MLKGTAGCEICLKNAFIKFCLKNYPNNQMMDPHLRVNDGVAQVAKSATFQSESNAGLSGPQPTEGTGGKHFLIIFWNFQVHDCKVSPEFDKMSHQYPMPQNVVRCFSSISDLMKYHLKKMRMYGNRPRAALNLTP